MAVAAINLGADQQMTVESLLSNGSIPASARICETNLTTGACLANPVTGPLSTRVKLAGSGGASAYSVFVQASAPITFDPANVRVIVRFKDQSGVIRGATSTALRTRDIVSVDNNQDGLWDDAANNAQALFNQLAPGQANALDIVKNLMQNVQMGMLLADVNDLSVSNAAAAAKMIACIYFRALDAATAAKIVASLPASMLTNADRLRASMAQSDRNAGVSFDVPPIDASACQ
jgi:hypothetical protein